MKSDEIALSPELLNGLKEVNDTGLSEFQKTVIPIILEGNDALIETQDKDEKYTSFVIPVIETASQKHAGGTRALILTSNSPYEISRVFSELGSHTRLKAGVIDDESEQADQEEVLQSGAEVLIARPPALMKCMRDLRFIFRDLDLLVIDAAGELKAGNFEPEIGRIVKRILCDVQTVIYADQLDEIQDTAHRYLNEPIMVGRDGYDHPQLLNKPPKVDKNLSHGYIYVPNRMKITTLMAHLDEIGDDRCVIFTASKRGTDRLYRILRKNNLKATSLHGNLSEEKRAQRFANFTNGDIQFLLVADISASDLDLRRVKRVVNYDVPGDADEYRYRASLVGAGKAIRLVSLVSKQDRSDINQLENELGQAPRELPLPEKVKQELNKRKKQKNKQPSKSKSTRKKPRSSRGKKPQVKKQGKKELELPRPSFDKLSGGRSGKKKKDNKSGVIGMLKKIFS